ncbi:MAG: amidohydrolase family protein, partial [Lentisphaeria bacterium]|nr:amidohydrolase family protein [Lentisphaeria bacterium]
RASRWISPDPFRQWRESGFYPHGKTVRIPARSPRAEAFGIDAGVIEEGRLADCILVDLNNHNLVPGFNLISDMVYAADSSCVDTVICDGRILMRGGHVDGEEEIVAEARDAAKRLTSK